MGGALRSSLLRVGDVTPLAREQLDLCNPDDIRHLIRSLRPNLIVNAAAYTAVDRAESEPGLAQAINADAPQIIAEMAREVAASVVHYSTDYVFDGAKSAPYVEADPPNPVSVYGKSKLAGELAIQQAGIPHLIFARRGSMAARAGILCSRSLPCAWPANERN